MQLSSSPCAAAFPQPHQCAARNRPNALFFLQLTTSAQVIIPSLMQRWTHFAQVAAAAAYDASQMGAAGGDMCVPLLRSLTCVFNSAGLPAFAPFFESIVHPAVQRIAAAVATDGESEYFDEDGIWHGFMSNLSNF